MKKIGFIILFSMLMAFALSSCIRENLDSCKGKISLQFRYVGDGTTDIFPEKIEKVTLFAYSVKDNTLAGKLECDKNALDRYQGVEMELYPGEYRIVCWGNALADTEINLNEKYVAATGYSDGNIIKTNDRLYFSEVDINVPSSLKRTEAVCDFTSSHIKMQVKLEGFIGAAMPASETGTKDNICLTMAGLPAVTDFSNVTSGTVGYYPQLEVCEDDPSSFVAKYNVMRFTDQNEVEMILTGNGDKELISFSLSEFMKKYDIAVEGINEAVVSILIRAGKVGIEVVDWDVENVDPGFDKD